MKERTRRWIEDLKVGDLVPDCFGDTRKITKIVVKDEDMFGKLFVVLYVEFGPNSSMSRSFKEGDVARG